jgi:hypothetical protein
MEKMMEPEVEAAAAEVLAYLDVHGDGPVLAVRDALGKPELYFYMGLGELILRRKVAIRESRGIFWTIRIPPAAKVA